MRFRCKWKKTGGGSAVYGVCVWGGEMKRRNGLEAFGGGVVVMVDVE